MRRSVAVVEMADESTKKRIIEAAGPIFAELGFEKATVRDICATADVNLASINYYFGDKRHLYLETVKFARTMRAERYPLPEWDPETPAEEKLYDMVSTLLRRLMALKSAPWQVKLVMREVMQPTAAGRQLVQDYFRPYFDQLLSLVDELSQDRLAADERLKIGFSIIGQCLHYRYGSEVIALVVPADSGAQFEVEQLSDHISRFSLAAIRNYRVDQRAATSSTVIQNK